MRRRTFNLKLTFGNKLCKKTLSILKMNVLVEFLEDFLGHFSGKKVIHIPCQECRTTEDFRPLPVRP